MRRSLAVLTLLFSGGTLPDRGRMPGAGVETAEGFRRAFVAGGARDPGADWCGLLISDLRKVINANVIASGTEVLSPHLAAAELGPVMRRLGGALRVSGGPTGKAAAY